MSDHETNTNNMNYTEELPSWMVYSLSRHAYLESKTFNEITRKNRISSFTKTTFIK